MANAIVTKGSTVEVSSDDPGFHGAWYVATVVDEVKPPPTKKTSSNKKTKKLKKTGFLVKYNTLLKEDSDEPLTEVVDPSFVRPLPPRNVRRNSYGNVKEAELEVVDSDGGDFELNDVVDAYHRDGWWCGVVKSVIVKGEMRKYNVEFENPREECEFEKSNLRFHVDWVDCRWMIPPKKTPDKVVGDRNASNDAHSGFTTPAKGTDVPHVDKLALGSPLSAKRNSRLRTRSETGSAVTSVTYSRNKRKVNSLEVDSGKKKLQSSAGGNGNAKAVVIVLDTSGSDDILQDSPPRKHALNITQTREAEDGQSHQKKKKGRKTKLAVKKLTGLPEDGHEVTNVDELPLSVLFKGMRPFSVLKRSSCFSPPANSVSKAVITSGVGAGSPTTDNNQQDWPFIKRAPIWDAVESLELYKKPPQKPHFSPLKNMQKDFREGLAIALMVTYGNLVQGLEDLQLNVPIDIINASLETLCELETHGFDVGAIRRHLNELLSLKSKVGPHEDKRNEFEKELEKCNHEKSVAEKEIDRLKAEMQKLEEKTLQTAAVQKAKEEEIVRLQTSLDLVSKEINECEVAFEKLCKKGLTLA